MKKNIIIGILGILLIASLITNFVLVNKLNTKEQPKEETNSLTGVYYNSQNGTIELKDNNKCMYLYETNTDCTYEVEDNKIKFHYYNDPHYEKAPDGKCYLHDSKGITNTETPCIEEHDIEGTVVKEGLIVLNGMYSKVS